MTNTTENKAKSTPGQKLAWGFGGFAENLGINVVPSLAYNIFSIGMGISPFIVGIATGASRIVEAITDPIIGNWSDNSKSKMGRRRPFIFFGAIIISIIFVAIWFTPRTGWVSPKELKNASVSISNVKLGNNAGKTLHFKIGSDSSYVIEKDSASNTLNLVVNQKLKSQNPFKLDFGYTYGKDSIKTLLPDNDLSYSMDVTNNSTDTVLVKLAIADTNGRTIQSEKIIEKANGENITKEYVIGIKVNPKETKSITAGAVNYQGHKLSGKFTPEKDDKFDVSQVTTINVSVSNNTLIPSYFFGIAITQDSLLQSIYFILIVSLFFMTFAIWQIPFSALGLELEEDYNERTKLQQYKLYFSYIIGTVIGSLYLWSQYSGFGGDEVDGMHYLGFIMGAVMLVSGILPALICKERYKIESHKEKIKFIPAVVETFKCRPFLLLMAVFFFVFFSLFFMLPLLSYISMYHVCKDGTHTILEWSWKHFPLVINTRDIGHKELAGNLGSFAAIIQTATQILSVILISRISKFFDKKTILISGLVVAIIGYVSSWYLFNPAMPYLSIIPPIVVNIGLCACWVLIGSFSADVCDYDEMNTGKRREGMFSAITGFLIKLSIALVIAFSSWVLVMLGIDGADPILSVDQLFTLRWFYIAVPSFALLIAIVFMIIYPLTKSKVLEIQEQLLIKRAQE